ncbi:PREDICTED: uncharacterized protein LOC101303247 [Fragaria vesca subsp. vesca]|uniref:uncharacterized protein LOC101303247 n=1 Tax=Fragaria vesca subsp. vesca TaxID=101020 RepID=UPI0002C33FB9|nr:PREDICTED: uncharacterized protein LOC101303247 [Fragaria vesca subsp. vesca]
MYATIISEPVGGLPAPESQAAAAPKLNPQSEIESAKCECCGLTEECTPAYIEHVRERNMGHWICGLCSEAIKDEIVRSERLLSTEEAMATHMNFCMKFKASGPPLNPTIHLISAMTKILRRSLDSPRGSSSTPSTPMRMGGRPGLTRSGSCFPALTGVE